MLRRRLCAESAKKRKHRILVLSDPRDSRTARLERCLRKQQEGDSTFDYLIGNDANSLREYAENADVILHSIFSGGDAKIIEDIWSDARSISLIHSFSAGVDGLVPILRKLEGIERVRVTNAKGAFDSSLAEWVLTSMLYFNKQIPRIVRNKEGKKWDRFTMGQLRNRTVGFVGFGSIAQRSAKLCRNLGMKIIALRRRPDAPGSELADEVLSLDGDGKRGLFERSDFVVCALPGTPSTANFVDESCFSSMKKSGVFISIGRGTCVDEDALIKALRAKSILGAAIDVFQEEPLPQSSGLWDLGENLLLTPHNADLTDTYVEDSFDVFISNLNAHRSGKDFPTVDISTGY